MIDIDDQCVAHYEKMIKFHQDELERWNQMLNNATDQPTEAVVLGVTITSSDDNELSVEDEKQVCPGCIQLDTPVCASQVVNGVEEVRTFLNEECMKQTNCDENKNWTTSSTGICEVTTFP